MFSPDQAPSVTPPQDATTNEPNSIENFTALICSVLRDHLNLTAAEDTLTADFSTKAELNPPDTLEKLYAAFPATNILLMQYTYDSLTTVYSENAAATFRTIVVDEDHPVFLVYSTTLIKHPEHIAHYFTILKLLNNLSLPLHDSVLAYMGNLIEADITATTASDPRRIIPGDVTFLTNIINFDSAIETLDPIQVLVSPPTSTHTRKHIAIPAAAYIAPQFVPTLLHGRGPVSPLMTYAYCAARQRNYDAQLSASVSGHGCTRLPHKRLS